VTFLLATILLQVPETKDYANGWQWVAGAVFIVASAAVIYLNKENGKLRDKLFDDSEKRGADWKIQAETCATDFGKTSEALKVSNDTTVIIVGKVDKITQIQDKLGEKMDRNWEQISKLTSNLDGCAAAVDRLSTRLSRSGE
jgi:hypothetical protein